MNEIYTYIYSKAFLKEESEIHLSDAIYEHVNKYKHNTKRAYSLNAWHSLREKLIEKFNIDINNKELYVDIHSKPHIQGIHISIAHTRGYYGFSFSFNANVGFDVEDNEVIRNDKTLLRYLTNEEKEHYLKERNQVLFYELFTKKEALGKMLGTGLTSKASLENAYWYTSICDKVTFSICSDTRDVIHHIYYNNERLAK